MNHVKAIVIKFISSLILLSIILGYFYDMAFRNVFLISLVLGIVSYLIGDLFILPRTNNTMATIADFGLALLVIWVMTENLTYGTNEFTMSVIAALGITIFEFFFHKYISNNVIRQTQNEENIRSRNMQYQTEASEEFTPAKADERIDREDRV